MESAAIEYLKGDNPVLADGDALPGYALRTLERFYEKEPLRQDELQEATVLFVELTQMWGA